MLLIFVFSNNTLVPLLQLNGEDCKDSDGCLLAPFMFVLVFVLVFACILASIFVCMFVFVIAIAIVIVCVALVVSVILRASNVLGRANCN